MKKVIILVLGLLWTLSISAQNRKIQEKISMTIAAKDFKAASTFNIKNINGDVKVIGYDGDEIQIVGSKTIKKKRGTLTQREADTYELRKELYEGVLYVYVYTPGARVEFKDGRMSYSTNRNDDDEYDETQFDFYIEVKVPKKMILRASTINGGLVEVENMHNGVFANNINGGVSLKEVSGKTMANTVNGNIKVWFSKSPKVDTKFNTVNGDIEIYSPKDLSTRVTFESLHGELYTDFEQVKRLPNRLDKEQDGSGSRYKINSKSPIQIGQGGPEMEFKLVNGNVYIRVKKS